MTRKTLVSRYAHLGYIPNGLDRDMEVAGIIKWLYEKHDITITLQYHDHIHIKTYRKAMPEVKMKRFSAGRVWNTSTEHSNTIYGERYFDNPYDALFDAVRDIYKAVKFQLY